MQKRRAIASLVDMKQGGEDVGEIREALRASVRGWHHIHNRRVH